MHKRLVILFITKKIVVGKLKDEAAAVEIEESG